jgi:Fe-S-cluster-containing hydrogenase component 2
MNPNVRRMYRAFIDQSLCVGCGCCVKVCPKSAIQLTKGAVAQVNTKQCVGCRKCAKECPASVITIQEVS